jgi:hypothetical protein
MLADASREFPDQIEGANMIRLYGHTLIRFVLTRTADGNVK